MADSGCPLLGDGKYGDGQVNRRYGETRQALYSYRLTFAFPTDAGLLNYLRGRSFQVESVPFREKYFPAPVRAPGIFPSLAKTVNLPAIFLDRDFIAFPHILYNAEFRRGIRFRASTEKRGYIII